MNQTTNISPDKGGTQALETRIKFDLNPLNYKCFISDPKKPYHIPRFGTCASPEQIRCMENPEYSYEQSRSSSGPTRVSELRIPFLRRGFGGPMSCCQEHQLFNTQVVFMQYDANQVYTDSTIVKNTPETEKSAQEKDLSSSVCSEASEENDIVKSCLKMLADEEQTDTELPEGCSKSAKQAQKKSALTTNGFIPKQSSNHSASMYQPQKPSQFSDNSFMIYLPRIVEDGRTTVMIRNIPNKYTESLLLELFNKNHKKKIDFFYLPIDYKNNCNVGYAFMNFTHPKYIEDFYLEFHNKKWKLFNSEKICHICYARIQGTSQLSHHFESSKRFREGSQHGYRQA